MSISRESETSSSSSLPRKVTLALGGSFNPVHTQHVEVMQIAKEHLENAPGSNIRVVEGFLAPSTDGYLLSKMKRKNERSDDEVENFIIKSQHRINMCNLATSKYSWLKPVDKCFGSAYECAEHLKTSPEHQTAIVIGADRATTPNGKHKWRREFKRPVITVIVGRNDETKRIRQAWDEDVKKNLIVHAESYFIVDQCDTRGVSSTGVRREMRGLFNRPMSAESSIKIQELVHDDILDARVAEYLIEHKNDLIF